MREPTPQHLCPRCGYDVSGVVPTWTDSCPLQGRCSECGLVYEWVDIFRPERVYPTWSIEHATRRRPVALAKTIWTTLRPGRLWSELTLVAPVRIRPLLVMVLLMMLATHLLSIGVAVKVYDAWLWTRAWVWPTPGSAFATTTTSTIVFDWAAFGRVAAWPYHYEWGRLIGPLGQLGLLWGVFAPLPYFILEQTMATAKVRRSHLLRGAAMFFPPLAFLLLLDIIVLITPWYFGAGWPIWFHRAWTVFAIGLFLAASVWIVRWWWLFTSRYLRLPRARAVLAAMMTISFLASLSICLFVDEDLRQPIGQALNWAFGWAAF